MQAIEEALEREVGEPVEVTLPPVSVITSEDVDRIVASLQGENRSDHEVLELKSVIERLKETLASRTKQHEDSLNELQKELEQAVHER